MWDVSHTMTAPNDTSFQRFVAAAIAALPKSRNYYDRQLQERLGTKGKPLFDIARRPNTPKRETLKAVADVLQQPLDLLIRAADGEDVDLASASPTTAPPPAPAHAASDRAPTRDASEGETIAITALDLSASMGPGTLIEDFVEAQPIMFDIGLLRSLTRSEYHRLRMVRGIGDSMEPTLRTGDRVLVDTTDKALARLDGIYWITLYGAHGIKRLKPAGRGSILVISDNRAVAEPQEVDAEDVTIEGRVIWFARDL